MRSESEVKKKWTDGCCCYRHGTHMAFGGQLGRGERKRDVVQLLDPCWSPFRLGRRESCGAYSAGTV